MLGVPGGQKRVLDPLGLEFQMVVSHCVCWQLSPGLLREQPERLTAEPALQSLFHITFEGLVLKFWLSIRSRARIWVYSSFHCHIEYEWSRRVFMVMVLFECVLLSTRVFETSILG